MRLALLRGVGPEGSLGAVDLSVGHGIGDAISADVHGRGAQCAHQGVRGSEGFTRTRAPAKSSGDASGFFAPKA